MIDLYHRSIDIILENQSQTGAFPASPNFPTYRYCWFRDGAFIAYAMNLAGQHESARRFHQWAAAVINHRSEVVKRAVLKAKQGLQLDAADILDTRYTVDGRAGKEEWPNFQLDGIGTWLWAVGQHLEISGEVLPESWLSAANLAADYLSALWERPCFDCWEEFPDQVHMHTLAAIFGGLQSHSTFSGVDHSQALQSIRHYLCQEGVFEGHFAKYAGAPLVDASLLGLAVPYRIVAWDDPVMVATVKRIESDLLKDGGVHRYSEDTYYGGGAWLLLTAWLGWYYAETDQYDKAVKAKEWVEAQTDNSGNMPEQATVNLNDPAYFTTWLKRWGDIASPLLWSHAKYIILCANLSTRS